MPLVEKTILTRRAAIRLTESSGTALPIVMLHGSGSTRRVFAKQLSSPLADIHRMIALDLPGHGESGNAFDPAATYTLPGLAATVSDILSELEVSRAILFGWSLGGHVAVELMSSQPLAAGLMLTGSPPLPRGALGLFRGFHAHRDMLLASKSSYSERDVARFARICFRDSADPVLIEAIRRCDGRLRTILSRSMLKGEGSDQKSTVEEADVPVAIVNGAEEPLVRLSYLGGLSYRMLWEGRVHAVEGAGHAPFWEKADVFNLLFVRFVRDVLEREYARAGKERKARGAA